MATTRRRRRTTVGKFIDDYEAWTSSVYRLEGKVATPSERFAARLFAWGLCERFFKAFGWIITKDPKWKKPGGLTFEHNGAMKSLCSVNGEPEKKKISLQPSLDGRDDAPAPPGSANDTTNNAKDHSGKEKK